MKRLIIVLIVLCICMSLFVLPSYGEGSELPSGGKYWLTDEKVTISAFIIARALSDDYVNNDFTHWLEENTNVKLDFVVTPEDEAKEKYNLLLSSDDYPEIQLNIYQMTRDEVNVYGKQGIIIPLNDLIEEYSVYLQQLLVDYPIVKDFVTLEDGLIYTMPSIGSTLHVTNTYKMWVYQPWLDQLGLNMPQTTEEFYEVLKAFKEGDPNGNERAVEVIPAVGCQKGWCCSPEVFLMNSFIHHNGSDMTWVEDGKVDVTYDKPEWKEGLKYMRRLVEEGLLAKETFFQDGAALAQLGEFPDAQIIGFTWGGYQGCFADMRNMERWPKYAVCPPLEGPDGVRLAPYLYNNMSVLGTFITDKCKRPDIAFRLMDLMYDTDVFMRKHYGIEGKNWRWAEPGEMGFAGPGVFKMLEEYGTIEKNVVWDQMGPGLQTEAFHVGQVVDVETNPMEKILYEGTRDMLVPYRPSLDNLYPNVLHTQEEAIELSVIETELRLFVNEMLARFVTGDVDIDSGWDEYLHQLDSRNLVRFLEIKQAAYDRVKG